MFPWFRSVGGVGAGLSMHDDAICFCLDASFATRNLSSLISHFPRAPILMFLFFILHLSLGTCSYY